MDLKMLIPTIKVLQKEIQSICNFCFLNIVKIEPLNKVQSFFLEKNAFNACKTSLFISFISLMGKIFEEVFCAASTTLK
jgi:hypothetical protein